MQIVSLKCTSCGGDLKIGPEVEHFACGFCGTSQVVQRDGGIIVLKEMEAAIAKVQLGTDRTAAELAIRRLKEDLQGVIADLKRVREANAAEKQSSQKSIGIGGALVALVPMCAMANSYSTIGVLWFIVIAIGTLYIAVQAGSRIDGRYQVKINQLLDRKHLAQKRLAEQIRIVDA